ncbi:MAG: MBL fold metallo-hydrolase, partial [Planctomycetes bacterium]|nr:MBL fold metallo-hydrolase [Planctomycetota bacterium]
ERMQGRWEQIDSDRDGFATLAELKARDARVGGGAGGGERGRGGEGEGRPPGTGGGAATGERAGGNAYQPSAPFTAITVGTGSPKYDPERSGPCTLIQHQGRYYLVDVGNGTQARLEEAGIPTRQIAGLLLTHHHLDHNEEFIPLFLHPRLAGQKLEVFGPPGTAKLAAFVEEIYQEDLSYRLQRRGRTLADLGAAPVRDLAGGESFALGALQVKTARVNHTIHTVAYRFEAEGRSITVSGDLTYSESLIELARNADVLVMDSGAAVVRSGAAGGAAGGGGDRAEGGREGAAGGERVRAHSTLEEVAGMAEKAGVKRLVLTHIAIPSVDEAATVAAVGRLYHGEVIVARDLLEVVPAAPAAAPAESGKTPSGAGGRTRVYVNAAAVGPARDGRAWATAFAGVQEGLDAAAHAGGGDLWVARGTYTPTGGADRAASIRLSGGVALYGGFAGTESALDERDPEANPTVLSGDIGVVGDDRDNSYHVVTGADNALLDGFTICGGRGAEVGGPGGAGGGGQAGGGARRGPPGGGGQAGGQIHVTPDAVLRGANPGAGAGMLNFQCAPTVRNCLFRDNRAGKGGAMYNMVCRSFPPRPDATVPAPQILDCRFVGNSARGRGGAIANDLGTSPTLRGCSFIGNACDEKGGAIYNDFGCSPLLVNCLFAENRARSAGALGNDGGSSPVLVHCTFTRNVALEEGAALYQGTGPANSPVLVGCILWEDACANGPAEVFNWHDNDPFVSGSCIQGGYPGEGNSAADPLFADPAAGDYGLRPGSPCAGIGHTAATSAAVIEEARRRAPAGSAGRRPEAAARPSAPAGAPVAVVYVNAEHAAGPGDGSSWGSAYRSLGAALAANAGTHVEVWVAAGTYRPGEEGSARTASFALWPGVEIYGGFGGREARRAERDPASRATVLCGDLGRAGDPADNAYHVVVGADRAVLDGVTVCHGNADGRTRDAKGGGLVNYPPGPQLGPMGAAIGYSPVLRNCTFTLNLAREGGAVYSFDRGTPEFVDCRFLENSAEYGGAVVDRVGVRSSFTRCVFERNAAARRAGAIYLDYGARPTLEECRFVANRAGGAGGALALVSRASQLEATIPLFRKCVFEGNRAGTVGGALAALDNAIGGLEECTLTDNVAQRGGGALALEMRSRCVLLECRLTGNRAEEGEAEAATDTTSSVSRNRADWPDQGAAAPGAGAAPPGGAPGGGPAGSRQRR